MQPSVGQLDKTPLRLAADPSKGTKGAAVLDSSYVILWESKLTDGLEKEERVPISSEAGI